MGSSLRVHEVFTVIHSIVDEFITIQIWVCFPFIAVNNIDPGFTSLITTGRIVSASRFWTITNRRSKILSCRRRKPKPHGPWTIISVIGAFGFGSWFSSVSFMYLVFIFDIILVFAFSIFFSSLTCAHWTASVVFLCPLKNRFARPDNTVAATHFLRSGRHNIPAWVKPISYRVFASSRPPNSVERVRIWWTQYRTSSTISDNKAKQRQRQRAIEIREIKKKTHSFRPMCLTSFRCALKRRENVFRTCRQNFVFFFFYQLLLFLVTSRHKRYRSRASPGKRLARSGKALKSGLGTDDGRAIQSVSARTKRDRERNEERKSKKKNERPSDTRVGCYDVYLRVGFPRFGPAGGVIGRDGFSGRTRRIGRFFRRKNFSSRARHASRSNKTPHRPRNPPAGVRTMYRAERVRYAYARKLCCSILRVVASHDRVAPSKRAPLSESLAFEVTRKKTK